MTGAELATVGGAGIGAAWGWLVGAIAPPARPAGLVAVAVASGVLFAEAGAIGGAGSATATVVAAGAGAAARVVVRTSLARRHGPPSSEGT